MEKKVYKTSGTCSTQLSFDYENGRLYNLVFQRGCDGNLKAIGKLCEGMELTKIVELLEGNKCGFKTTSCADQLAKAIREVL